MVMLALALLLSCGGDAVDPKASTAESGPSPLPPAALLSRLSLDLRGRRPTEAELDRAEADPAEIEALVTEFLHDPGFAERVFFLYADVYKTRADEFIVGANGDAEFHDLDARYRFTHAAGDEPLKTLAFVADQDRPWTDIVNLDWTFANEDLLAHWPLEALEEGEGWVRAQYTDGRPTAGVLSTNGMWWRYTSTTMNVNRTRAEAVARIFVCDRRFDQPVALSGAITSTTDLLNRSQNDPACVSCHVALDPIGSYLYGFWRTHAESYSEAIWYYPNLETHWTETTEVAPAWYGEPGENLFDLGRQIADDPRFVTCAVEQGHQFFFGALPTIDDAARVQRARETFLQEGLTLRALYRALTAEPAYRSADPSWPGAVTTRRLSPDQMNSAVADLTGFQWEYAGLNMMTTDNYGVRVLAGGADGILATEPTTDHAATEQLVIERLSEAAAEHAVADEAAQSPEARRLFREIARLDEEQTEDDLRRQMKGLIRRCHGRRVAGDSDDVAALLGLWSALRAEGATPAEAWRAVLSALLRHPDFLHY